MAYLIEEVAKNCHERRWKSRAAGNLGEPADVLDIEIVWPVLTGKVNKMTLKLIQQEQHITLVTTAATVREPCESRRFYFPIAAYTHSR